MADAGSGKADFTSIYTAPDPRPYFSTLGPLGYQVPRHAEPVVEAVLDVRPGATVLDVCCSYGINAALLRGTVGYDDLVARHTDPARAGLPSAQVVADDAAFHAAHRHPAGPHVVGLDASAPAVGYGTATGLLDAGFAEDLETRDPSPALTAALAGVDVVMCTGGIGYVGPATFRRLLDAAARPERMFVVAFVLRVFDYAPVVDVLDGFGLVTDRIPAAACRQRRFADADERAAACRDVAARGLDPTGYEAAGWYHADCFVTRPADVAPPLPGVPLTAAGVTVPGPRAARDRRSAPARTS